MDDLRNRKRKNNIQKMIHIGEFEKGILQGLLLGYYPFHVILMIYLLKKLNLWSNYLG